MGKSWKSNPRQKIGSPKKTRKPKPQMRKVLVKPVVKPVHAWKTYTNPQPIKQLLQQGEIQKGTWDRASQSKTNWLCQTVREVSEKGMVTDIKRNWRNEKYPVRVKWEGGVDDWTKCDIQAIQKKSGRRRLPCDHLAGACFTCSMDRHR